MDSAGHVGVVNTCMVTGLSTAAMRERLSEVSVDWRPPASRTACTNEMNS